MIKIVTAYSGPGGSTTAFANLCNLFNASGLRCELYGVSDWVKSQLATDCFKTHAAVSINKNDTVLWHMLKPPAQRLFVRKLILSCHETNLYPVKEFKHAFHAIHFVSQFQKDWHGVDGVVIPNVINKFTRTEKRVTNKVAGIIGSIDSHKRVHLSIERAITNPAVERVELWGPITDHAYFNAQVLPFLGGRVAYHGVAGQMQAVYDRLDIVYSSSQRECLPMIQGECIQAGVEFDGLPESARDASDYIFDDGMILDKWRRLLA